MSQYPALPTGQSSGPYVPPPQLHPALDAGGTVVADLPCRKCQYNLRGLSINGRCPECGSAVGLSAQGDLLRFAEPAWVRTLHRGVRVILYGIVAIIIAIVLTMGVAAVAGPITSQVVGALGGLAGQVLIVYGSWLLTEPDPSGLGEAEYGTVRKIIRFALIAGIVSTLVDFISEFSTNSPAATVVLVVLGVIFGIIGLVGLFAQLTYLRRLAMRIPDPSIAGRAKAVMWGLGIGYGLMIVLGAIVAIIAVTSGAAAGVTPGGGAVGAMVGFGCAMALVGLVMLVFAVMYLVLLINLGKRLNEQATIAEQSWARTGQGSPPPMPVQQS